MEADNRIPDPLPEEAAEALERSGAHLLHQLDAMRADASADPELEKLEPLDTRAMLALRQHGDGFVQQLAAQRAAETEPPALEKKKKRWGGIAGLGIAAGLAGMISMVQFIQAPPGSSDSPDSSDVAVTPVVFVEPEEKVQPEPLVAPLGTITSVPEPSSALLTLCGALCLFRRRRTKQNRA